MKITNLSFVPTPQIIQGRGDRFIGFVNFEIENFFLNSVGVFRSIDGKIKITFPARKLKSGIMKNYFKPKSQKIYDEILNTIKQHLNDYDYKNFTE